MQKTQLQNLYHKHEKHTLKHCMRTMNILINASNLKAGGGLQVADSICKSLNQYPAHRFTVVLSTFFPNTAGEIKNYPNVEVHTYNVKNNLQTLLFGRDKFLDSLVEKNKIDVALTVFGPSRWNPRCKHLSGFALSFLVMPESPYFQRMNWKEKLQATFRNKLWEVYFRRSAKYFFTENPMISERVERLFKGSKVFTVTNYYNQVFDQPENWVEHLLPKFNGISLLNISTPYPHKNLNIAIDILKVMRSKHPDLHLRFVYTIEESDMPKLPADMKENFLFIGRVNVEECPSLYQQCEISFQPTLLECFTASYPEAMRMERPIVTTSMPFAQGLCGKAAAYYSPLNAEAAAESIYKVATDSDYRKQLIDSGKEQLKTYDTYNDRARKLIELCAKLAKEEYSF